MSYINGGRQPESKVTFHRPTDLWDLEMPVCGISSHDQLSSLAWAGSQARVWMSPTDSGIHYIDAISK